MATPRVTALKWPFHFYSFGFHFSSFSLRERSVINDAFAHGWQWKHFHKTQKCDDKCVSICSTKRNRSKHKIREKKNGQMLMNPIYLRCDGAYTISDYIVVIISFTPKMYVPIDSFVIGMKRLPTKSNRWLIRLFQWNIHNPHDGIVIVLLRICMHNVVSHTYIYLSIAELKLN